LLLLIFGLYLKAPNTLNPKKSQERLLILLTAMALNVKAKPHQAAM